MKNLVIITVASALLAAAPVQAALIVNGDFTADNWPANTFVPASTADPSYLTSITGWTLLPGATIVGIGAGGAGIPTPSLELTGWFDNAPGSGLSQTLGTTAGNSYTVGFTIYDFPNSNQKSNINFSINGNLIGSNLSGQTATGQSGSYTYSYDFTSLSGSDVISFVWPGPALSTQVSVLANVTVTTATPVPEPGTWAAMAVLAGGAALARWRKRRGASTEPVV